MNKVIDSFFVALGFKVDPAGLEGLQKQAAGAREKILSMGTAISGLVAGLGIAKIAKIGSQFESNTIAIAGFLSALGISSDFNKGLEDASETIRQITIDAAKLPGEAEEYVEVFKAALPFVQKAIPGGSLKDFTNFTNQMTAIGRTLGVDAEQIGRDTALMLGVKGRAGAHVKTFQQLLPFLRNLKGQANLTGESFNAMTQPQRLQLLEQAFKGLQPMLAASADSFDAMWGAAKSSFTQITRLATAGLFKTMKDGLNQLNAYFFDAKGNLTDFGKGLIDNIRTAVRWSTQLITMVASVIRWIATTRVVVAALKAALVLLAPYLAGKAFLNMAGRIGNVVTALTKMKKAVIGNTMLIGGLVVAIALITEDLYQFYNGGESVTGMLVKKWAPAVYAVIGVLALLVGALIRTQAVAIATGVKMLVGWLIGLGPIGLTILAIGVLIGAFFLLRDNWDDIVKYMTAKWQGFIKAIKDAKHDVAVALGFGGTKDEQSASANRARAAAASVQGYTAPGADVIWTNPETGLQETHRAGWQPPTASLGRGAVDRCSRSSTSTVSQTTVTGTQISISGADDPGATARAVRSEIENMSRQGTRNAQTGVAY